MTKEEHDNSKDKHYDPYVLQNITSLQKSKEQNGKENRMQQSESKSTLDSRKSEKASSTSITEEDEKNDLKKLPCRSNPDIR